MPKDTDKKKGAARIRKNISYYSSCPSVKPKPPKPIVKPANNPTENK